MSRRATITVATPDNTALRVVATKSHKNPETEAYIGQISGLGLQIGGLQP